MPPTSQAAEATPCSSPTPPAGLMSHRAKTSTGCLFWGLGVGKGPGQGSVNVPSASPHLPPAGLMSHRAKTSTGCLFWGLGVGKGPERGCVNVFSASLSLPSTHTLVPSSVAEVESYKPCIAPLSLAPIGTSLPLPPYWSDKGILVVHGSVWSRFLRLLGGRGARVLLLLLRRRWWRRWGRGQELPRPYGAAAQADHLPVPGGRRCGCCSPPGRVRPRPISRGLGRLPLPLPLPLLHPPFLLLRARWAPRPGALRFLPLLLSRWCCPRGGVRGSGPGRRIPQTVPGTVQNLLQTLPSGGGGGSQQSGRGVM